MRSRMRSRSASATALRMVNTSLADTVAGDVAAEIDHVQADVLLLQSFEHAERVQGGAEHAVQLRRDDHVAGLQDCEQRLALRPLDERHRAGDAALDVVPVDASGRAAWRSPRPGAAGHRGFRLPRPVRWSKPGCRSRRPSVLVGAVNLSTCNLGRPPCQPPTAALQRGQWPTVPRRRGMGLAGHPSDAVVPGLRSSHATAMERRKAADPARGQLTGNRACGHACQFGKDRPQ